MSAAPAECSLSRARRIPTGTQPTVARPTACRNSQFRVRRIFRACEPWPCLFIRCDQVHSIPADAWLSSGGCGRSTPQPTGCELVCSLCTPATASCPHLSRGSVAEKFNPECAHRRHFEGHAHDFLSRVQCRFRRSHHRMEGLRRRHRQ